MTGLVNPEAIVGWILEHGEDEGIDDPIPTIKIKSPKAIAVSELKDAMTKAQDLMNQLTDTISSPSISEVSSLSSSTKPKVDHGFVVGSEVMLANTGGLLSDNEMTSGPLSGNDIGEVLKVSDESSVVRCQVKLKEITSGDLQVVILNLL